MLMRRKLVSSATSRGRLGLAGTPGEQPHPHAKLTQKLAYYGAEAMTTHNHLGAQTTHEELETLICHLTLAHGFSFYQTITSGYKFSALIT